MKTDFKNKKGIPRRRFIKGIASSAAGFIIMPRHILGGKGHIAPSDKVNVAIAGAGSQAMVNINSLFELNDVQIIAVADPAYYYKRGRGSEWGAGPVSKIVQDHYAAKIPQYKVTDYEDFRVMLSKEKSLDAILCASPDNTHAYISITSMRAGKHVYCEKPLTHNIWESRKVREVAKETGLATQMGNQRHSHDGLRQAVEILRAGVIGKVSEVHAWVPNGRSLQGLSGHPKESSPLPDRFNWDLWLGPTSWYPFNEAYVPGTWRDFWSFGNGALGDFGCHEMDTAVWAFNLGIPESVEVYPAGNEGSSEITAYGELGYFSFAGIGDQSPVKIFWYSGGLRPPRHKLLPPDLKLNNRGVIYIGEKGIILSNKPAGIPVDIFPESLRNISIPQSVAIQRSPGHHREWIDAIKGGPAPMSNFEYGTRLNEIVMLGTLSQRLGGVQVRWDSKNMKVIGRPEADEIIREPVRKGWEMI